ncbi:MAG: Flp pilus assembly complex ATPase component TadA [Nitrospirae bacterium]|nr:Flp pilus assembly complex ATPase component TadA [Nitrospirota bacterium]
MEDKTQQKLQPPLKPAAVAVKSASPAAPPKKLGDYLMDSKMVTKEQLDKALDIQKTSKKKLGDTLVDLGYLTVSQMSSLLTQQIKSKTGIQRKRLGDILIDAKIITEEQLTQALQTQKEKKGKIGQILIDLGFVTKDQIAEGISEKLKIPIISCAEYDILGELQVLVSKETAEKNMLIPLEKKGNTLIIAMADPLDYQAIDELSFKTGLKITPLISYDWAILKAIEKNYVAAAETSVEDNIFAQLGDDINADKEVEFVEQQEEDEGNMNIDMLYSKSNFPPIVKLVAMLVAEGSKSRASDIHIEPRDKYVQIRFRVDGELQNVFKYQKDVHPSVVSRIKIISKLDITNRRVPQDGSTHVSFNNKEIDLRVATAPTVYGEQIVIRILDHSAGIITIDALGMPENIKTKLVEVFKRPQGMLLVTGPTGSGKTTTLYSSLNELRSDARKVVTIEDPAEYKLEGITQQQVNDAVGRTFASILKSILRQDPDVIMLGEIRDLETAETAMKAALTGHFVLSTLHTNNTIATVTRLIEMGIPSYIVSSALSGVVAQRLVRRICTSCKIEMDVPPETAATMKSLGLNPPQKFWKGSGCAKCGHSGYSGRIAVYEFLSMTAEFKRILATGATESELFIQAKKDGVSFLFEDAFNKVKDGISTFEEILAKIPMEHLSKLKEPEKKPVQYSAPVLQSPPPPPKPIAQEPEMSYMSAEQMIYQSIASGMSEGSVRPEIYEEEDSFPDSTLNDFLRLG